MTPAAEDASLTAQKKTARERRLEAGGIVRLGMPVTPLSEATHSARVLNTTARDCIHLEMTEPNLDWLRGYLRAELVEGAEEGRDGRGKRRFTLCEPSFGQFDTLALVPFHVLLPTSVLQRGERESLLSILSGCRNESCFWGS